jgi:Holliday junction DNA helicase RuvA
VIGYLRGILLEKHPNQVILDVGGVGYDVNIPVSTFSALPEAGGEIRLRIHTEVREDALKLFGFVTPEEKSIFERLIAVSGIGPSLAIKVLSGLAAGALVSAIRGGDIAQLVRIPGVGKKTAERMVLELKDKLEGIGGGPGGSQMGKPAIVFSAVEQDVLSALVNLGCNRAAAEAAVKKARAELSSDDFEPFFRRALELAR